ncbi:hypothetical protein, partial [Tropicibacter naphthalenivorans]|uniref:hypothetical protein n=1 Tax=Tropicibacter naphthalenivorans TaxID=441103 RepID=UPI001C912C68
RCHRQDRRQREHHQNRRGIQFPASLERESERRSLTKLHCWSKGRLQFIIVNDVTAAAFLLRLIQTRLWVRRDLIVPRGVV